MAVSAKYDYMAIKASEMSIENRRRQHRLIMATPDLEYHSELKVRGELKPRIKPL